MPIGLLVATSLIPLSYGIGPNTRLDYTMTVAFEGFIPILGGQEGKAVVNLGFRVDGQKSDSEMLKASSELTKAEFIFNDAKLPLGLENVQEFFPKTTIQFTSLGKITKTDAPDISLPVKLPGLDVKRFPDISYLPIEFGSTDVEVGSSWEYTKPFSGSNVKTACKVLAMDDSTVTIELQIDQSYEVLEDSGLEIVTDPKDAEAKVTTSVKGTGKAVFDRERKVMRTYQVEAVAKSKVQPTDGSAESERELKTSVKVQLKP